MQTYTVRKGDTLGKIAVHFYGDPKRFPLIVAANAIANPDKLQVGQKLIIPDAGLIAAGVAQTVEIAPAVGQAPVGNLSHQRLSRCHPALASRGRAMLDLCAQGRRQFARHPRSTHLGGAG